MGRLIDVDKISFRCSYSGDCMASDDKCEKCSYYVYDYEEIQNQPTAYNVDNVVAELEEMNMNYFLTIANTGSEKLDIAYGYTSDAINKAIEIVRRGGVE